MVRRRVSLRQTTALMVTRPTKRLSYAKPRPSFSLSVAVLVELARGPRSGGHVKCWEHFAHVAAAERDIDLTLYVLPEPGCGSRARLRVDHVAPNVRFVPLRPVVGTARLNRVVGGVDASDLAPFHPELARRLPAHDVWHVTHTMSFAATALRLARRHRRVLVGSVHTDVPALTRVYAEQLLSSIPLVGQRLAPLQLGARAADLTRRRRDAVLRACARVLVANEADRIDVARAVPLERISMLRRGIDTQRFHPGRRDRAWLQQAHGVPEDVPIVLFAGRVDATKGALLLARAVRLVREAGTPLHLVVAGEGRDTRRVGRLLGRGATLLGRVAQDELARVAASCDLFALPSRTETAGNVVVEAMASGLPVLLPAGARTTLWLASDRGGGVLVDRDTARAWAHALAALACDPARRRRLRQEARETVEARHASWRQVLQEDLLPVWRGAAAGAVPTAGGDGSPR